MPSTAAEGAAASMGRVYGARRGTLSSELRRRGFSNAWTSRCWCACGSRTCPQWSSWRGDTAILVAVQIGPRDPTIAYGLDGRVQTLDASTPPVTSVLVLVPSELTRAQRATAAGNASSATRVGVSAARICDEFTPPEECDGGGGYTPPPYVPPTPPPAGLYVTETNVKDKAEPWTRGDPEMEFALLGTVTGQYYATPYFNAAPVLAYAPGEFRQLIACSGRQAPVVPDGRKRFDFNDQVRVYTQEVLLEQRDEFKAIEEPKGQYGVPLSRRQLAFHPPFYVEVWERDDGGECPTPATPFLPNFRVGVGFQTYPVTRFTGFQARESLPDVMSIFGVTNENDMMGAWSISTWDAFEQLTSTSQLFVGSRVNLRIKNTGVTSYTVPVEIFPYNP